MDQKITELLKKTRVVVAPETFTVISLSEEDWRRLLENPELSPRMQTPFLIFKDKWEITLVLDDIDFATIQPTVEKARIERNFRLLSFDMELEFDVVGFIARITKIFAGAGISVLPISSFSRDHLLVRQEDLAPSLKALGNFVDEVC